MVFYLKKNALNLLYKKEEDLGLWSPFSFLNDAQINFISNIQLMYFNKCFLDSH